MINDDDPTSIRLADYYREQKQIPQDNIVCIRLGAPNKTLPVAELEQLRRQIDASLDDDVQVLALAWALPYAVDCMSINGVLAFGFQPELCRHTCASTPTSPYFDSASRRPFADYRLRPSMLLAALSFDEAKALIDRCIAADRSIPTGTAYPIDASDAVRNARAVLPKT